MALKDSVKNSPGDKKYKSCKKGGKRGRVRLKRRGVHLNVGHVSQGKASGKGLFFYACNVKIAFNRVFKIF